MLLSADPLNYDICILQLNGLGGNIFYCHSDTAATGNLNKCGCEDIELIIHSGGCNRGNCAAQGLPLHSDGNGNGPSRAACWDGDVTAEHHLVAGTALVGQAAQGNNAGAVPVDDTVRAGNRRLAKYRILIRGNLLKKYVCKFSQKTHSFQKKIAAGLLPRRIVQHRHGAEHSSHAGKLRYGILAAAGVIAAAAGVRVRHLIGRNRHGIDPADQLRGLGFLVGSNKSVLRCLRRLELQGLILRSQRGNLVLSQEVQNGAAVGVGVVNNVPGAALDGVPGITCLGRHVIPHALNGVLDGRALGCQVVIHPVHSPLCLAAAILELVAQIAYGGVYSMETVVDGVSQGVGAVADTLLNAIDAALEVVQSKALIDVCTGSPALTGGRTQAIAGVTTPAAAIAAPAEHAKDQKQDDPGGPIAAPAAEAAVAALIGRSHGHGHHSAVRRKTHCVISFEVLFQIPAGNLIL